LAVDQRCVSVSSSALSRSSLPFAIFGGAGARLGRFPRLGSARSPNAAQLASSVESGGGALSSMVGARDVTDNDIASTVARRRVGHVRAAIQAPSPHGERIAQAQFVVKSSILAIRRYRDAHASPRANHREFSAF
jgi:hypothetical protein